MHMYLLVATLRHISSINSKLFLGELLRQDIPHDTTETEATSSFKDDTEARENLCFVTFVLTQVDPNHGRNIIFTFFVLWSLNSKFELHFTRVLLSADADVMISDVTRKGKQSHSRNKTTPHLRQRSLFELKGFTLNKVVQGKLLPVREKLCCLLNLKVLHLR